MEPVQTAMPELTAQHWNVANPTTPNQQVGSIWSPLVSACVGLSQDLSILLREFWGVPVSIRFLSASTQAQYFWYSEDFHVSQLSLPTAPSESDTLHNPAARPSEAALLHLSQDACHCLLSRVLGPQEDAFDLKRISPLESSILNEFSRDLLSTFRKKLLRRPTMAPFEAKTIHLTWVLQLDAADAQTFTDVGKIILSLPEHAVQPDALTRANSRAEPSATIDDAFFFHVQSLSRLRLGSTRIMLSDLEQLEPEDLIVLENSQANRMELVVPQTGQTIPFPVNIAHQQHITIPYTQEFSTMETQQQSQLAKQTLWDNLMIEVAAEFEPIKVPLKQLKEMSEGLVVEMGDLVHNRICLQVEGKPLAWGELLIVGDKFGVRINQIVANDPSVNPPTASTPSALAPSHDDYETPPHAHLSMEPHDETALPHIPPDSDENLDNFLNEDFDESFGNEEEETW